MIRARDAAIANALWNTLPLADIQLWPDTLDPGMVSKDVEILIGPDLNSGFLSVWHSQSRRMIVFEGGNSTILEKVNHAGDWLDEGSVRRDSVADETARTAL